MASSTPTTHVLTREPSGVRTRADAASRSSRRKGKWVLLGVGALVAAAAVAREPKVSRGDRRAAVAQLLADRGLRAQAEDVVFMDGPRGLASTVSRSRVLVRASVAMVPGPDPGVMVPSDDDTPTDIYLFDAKLSPSGSLLDLDGGYNLSETTGADETRPVVVGDHVAYASNSGVEGAPTVVTVLDFSGQPKLDWPFMARAQNAVTNLQTTGRMRGIGRNVFTVEAEGEVDVLADNGSFFVRTEVGRAELFRQGDGIAPLPKWIKPSTTEIAQPGNLVTWSVDRVRAEIGDDRMQAIKQAYFEAKDYFVKHSGEQTTEEVAAAISEEMGEEIGEPKKQIARDPETGWPPAPLEPYVTPSLPNEGEWNVKEDEAFYRHQPNLPPTYMTTFIRTDPTRKDTRVFVMVWDPRMIDLHMMAGTVEPKGATGNAGPGLIPRTPDVMKRVVAASNAGFQALHGEFGMMADGVVYLPPKPYAATVMRLRDGSTAFGTWPNDATVPDKIVSYRQNMTVMVQDEKFNPYDRTWWGGTVPGAEDKTHTVRTGICLTKEGFVAYFYGADLSPEALARGMIQTRCSFGIALDMNAGHSGMEFYKVAPSGQLPSVGRALDTKWEAEGDVPEMPGWEFHGKRLVKGMGLMNFPRYIKREARDYFYLTLRYVIPGDNLPTAIDPPAEGEGAWTMKGLPQRGFPYAMALAETRPDKSNPQLSFRVLELDPRTLTAKKAPAEEPGPEGRGQSVVVLDPGPEGGSSVWLQDHAFVVADASPGRGAFRIATGVTSSKQGAALACIQDESGMMFYAELKGGGRGDLGAMSALLAGIGCSQQVFLAEPLKLALGDSTDLGRTAVHWPKGPTAVELVRADAPAGVRFFQDTPVVPRSEWYPLQQQRVRYHKKANP